MKTAIFISFKVSTQTVKTLRRSYPLNVKIILKHFLLSATCIYLITVVLSHLTHEYLLIVDQAILKIFALNF